MLVLSGYVVSKSIEEKKYDNGRTGNSIKVKLSDNGVIYWATAYVPSGQTFIVTQDGINELELGSYVNLYVDIRAYSDQQAQPSYCIVIK